MPFNPGEEERRIAFSQEIVRIANNLGMSSAEIADSMLTIIIGIFMAHNLPKSKLIARVHVGWKNSRKMMNEIIKNRGGGIPS